MALQAGKNVAVAVKVQSALGTPASGGSGIGVRVNEGFQGLKLTKAVIPNKEVRRDGETTRGRHGSRKGEYSYPMNLMVDTLCQTMIEAAQRATWTAAVSITEATTLNGSAAATSITTTTFEVVAAAGSWITQGVRVGDMVKLTNHATAGNNAKWFRVVAVSALTLTLPTGSLTLNATPDAAFTLTVAKTIISNASGAAPTERYFTWDEFYTDILKGMTGTDAKVCKIEISAQPDENVVMTVTGMCLDVAGNETGTAILTSPTYSTVLPLVMVDGTIRVNGVDYTVLTGFSITRDLGGSIPSTNANTGADVFLNNAIVSGSFSALRADLTFWNAFRAETQVDFFVVFAENESQPWDFISVYVGNAVLDGDDGSKGSDGAFNSTIPWRAGKDEAGSSRAATTTKFSTSV